MSVDLSAPPERDQFLHHVLQVLNHANPIQEITDLVYEFWESPLTIYDTSFTLIARSSQYLPVDSKVNDVFSSGFNLSKFYINPFCSFISDQ